MRSSRLTCRRTKDTGMLPGLRRRQCRCTCSVVLVRTSTALLGLSLARFARRMSAEWDA